MSLPPELLLQVVDHLSKATDTLKALSCVDWLFYEAARKHLFRKVSLVKCLDDSLSRLWILGHWNLAKYVQELHVEAEAILSQHKIIEHEQCNHPALDKIYSDYRTLGMVQIRSISKNATQFYGAISGFLSFAKSLKFINIGQGHTDIMTYNYDDDFRLAVVEGIYLTLGLIDLEHLSVLEIDDCMLERLETICITSDKSRARYKNKINHFQSSTLEENLSRITALSSTRLSESCPMYWDVEHATKMVAAIPLKFPLLSSLSLDNISSMEFDTLNLLPLASLSLTELKLSRMWVSCLTQLLGSPSFTLRTLYMDRIQLNEDHESWATIFDTLHGIHTVSLSRLGYPFLLDDTKVHMKTWKFGSCELYAADIDAANELVERVIGSGGNALYLEEI